jgi:hypothetical protein
LKNFLEINSIPIHAIYKRGSWKSLCAEADIIEMFEPTNEKEITKAIKNKWLSTNSTSYFNFILKLAKNNFKVDSNKLNEEEQSMSIMLHYDVWAKAGGFESIDKSMEAIGKNPVMVEEIIEVLEILLDKISFKEINLLSESLYSPPDKS